MIHTHFWISCRSFRCNMYDIQKLFLWRMVWINITLPRDILQNSTKDPGLKISEYRRFFYELNSSSLILIDTRFQKMMWNSLIVPHEHTDSERHWTRFELLGTWQYSLCPQNSTYTLKKVFQAGCLAEIYIFISIPGDIVSAHYSKQSVISQSCILTLWFAFYGTVDNKIFIFTKKAIGWHFLAISWHGNLMG